MKLVIVLGSTATLVLLTLVLPARAQDYAAALAERNAAHARCWAPEAKVHADAKALLAQMQTLASRAKSLRAQGKAQDDL